ncbi:phosphoserine aminotransferase [Apiospora rasikravindrae]|uniref:Phosphoserine aminotransferase n=1 Tax=Apiospora rasikravindrae TaxID=990691 RepID=A0ABR1TW04_9PEZI
MVVIAVAGGLGDLGHLITNALLETGKHEVYVMSRKTVEDDTGRISPLTGERYFPVIQTDYSSEDRLSEHLTEHHIQVVICAFIMDNDSVSDAQLRLIRAAEKSPCVRRFIPTEFNVEYDSGDDILPYPKKRFHRLARRELEDKTRTLEYAYVYPGMFMDYFGLPRVESVLRPLCFFVDPAHVQAVLPTGAGEAKMSMTFTTDFARYLALALDLESWPRVLSTATSTVTLNELVRLAEKNLGRPLNVRYQPLEALLQHTGVDLPANLQIAAERWTERGGLEQLRALIADLEASVALGAYDLTQLTGHMDLVKTFDGKAPEPKRIEDLLEEAWGSRFLQSS